MLPRLRRNGTLITRRRNHHVTRRAAQRRDSSVCVETTSVLPLILAACSEPGAMISPTHYAHRCVAFLCSRCHATPSIERELDHALTELFVAQARRCGCFRQQACFG